MGFKHVKQCYFKMVLIFFSDIVLNYRDIIAVLFFLKSSSSSLAKVSQLKKHRSRHVCHTQTQSFIALKQGKAHPLKSLNNCREKRRKQPGESQTRICKYSMAVFKSRLNLLFFHSLFGPLFHWAFPDQMLFEYFAVRLFSSVIHILLPFASFLSGIGLKISHMRGVGALFFQPLNACHLWSFANTLVSLVMHIAIGNHTLHLPLLHSSLDDQLVLGPLNGLQ